jgi:molecular chaperone DnaK
MNSVSTAPQLGIDFGTTYSAMSWFDPKTNEAKIIPNLDGEAKTPSAVYYGARGVSVGAAAVNEFVDAAGLGEAESAGRFVGSIKRNLLVPPIISIPGGRLLRPVEVVTEIFSKLKHDAEKGHFHESVSRATVTIPATFSAEQSGVIETAANRAGFEEVTLLEEPVAAAMAFAGQGQNVGENILVYDLGGGTFDLAVLTRRPDGRFEVALPPAGETRCGGDDFDRSIYEYCEEQHRKESGQGFRRDGGDLDVAFLMECRRAKERLSQSLQVVVRRLAGGQAWQFTVIREIFESLIQEQVSRTMRKTESLLKQAEQAGGKVDTVVLVGGCTRVPLVYEQLKSVLLTAGIAREPLRYAHQDMAVALGASYLSARGKLKSLTAGDLVNPQSSRGTPVPDSITTPTLERITYPAKPTWRWVSIPFFVGCAVLIIGAAIDEGPSAHNNPADFLYFFAVVLFQATFFGFLIRLHLLLIYNKKKRNEFRIIKCPHCGTVQRYMSMIEGRRAWKTLGVTAGWICHVCRGKMDNLGHEVAGQPALSPQASTPASPFTRKRG